MEVTLQNLTKKFPARGRKNREDVIAVNDFTFEIPDGKLIGLLGPSGCGKSTTLNLISGLLKPNSGRIFFGEDDVTDLPPENRGIGLVFQNYALYPHLTVRQNILFPLQNLKGKDKLPKAVMLEKAQEAAKLVQINDLMERKPGELSGGQQQRVAIARALVKMPRVLLLDEPTSALDPEFTTEVLDVVRDLAEEGTRFIIVTHEMGFARRACDAVAFLCGGRLEEAMSISDRIVVMKDGVVQQIGKPQEVYDNPRNLFVAKFLGTPPINVFDGEVRGETLYIGKDGVLPARGVADQQVSVGIRPEGFLLHKDGSLRCELNRVEVMGRDISVVCEHPAALSPTIRGIIGAENSVSTGNKVVRFTLRPQKVFLFHKETQERIDTEGCGENEKKIKR
jgi:multiple sugar transport system ATP-binding protein